MFPGLCGDAAASSLRIFLGTQPALSVEQRLLRQVQAVYPWFASRKRVREAANEFLEVDLASIDSELLLRYAHIFFVRRQVHEEMLDRQLSLLETGKPPKAADPSVVLCLQDVRAAIAKRVQYELNVLSETKAVCTAPFRRELAPNAPLDHWDLLCMMRIVEEDLSPIVQQAESAARSFLPATRVHSVVAQLAKRLMGQDMVKDDLDKKEQRLWGRMHPTDYTKIGCVEKYRPLDVAAYFRFYGERIGKPQSSAAAAAVSQPDDSLRRALWGNIFRKYAQHPSYLVSMSRYWSAESHLDDHPEVGQLPFDVAEAACVAGQCFPALSLQTLAMYSSADVARQRWRVDPFVPLMRLFPLLGHSASTEALAYILVESFWETHVGGSILTSYAHGSGGGSNKSATRGGLSVVDDTFVSALNHYVNDCHALYNSNLDKLLTRVADSVAVAVPAPPGADAAVGISMDANLEANVSS